MRKQTVSDRARFTVFSHPGAYYEPVIKIDKNEQKKISW